MRLRNAIVVLACVGLSLLTITPCVSAEGLWCPKTERWVSVGDTSDRVLRKCGAPKSREDIIQPGCTDDGYCFVKIGERWIYDFGSNYLVRYLLFEGGRLTQIEVGDYGE